MWIEVLVLNVLIYKSYSARQHIQLVQCSADCKQKGLCEVDTHGKESCTECYSDFYENPTKGCEERDFCAYFSSHCKPNGECERMWGDAFCKCNPPYLGRFCDKEGANVVQISRPEILFNLEPEHEKTTAVLMYFSGGVGTDFKYDFKIGKTKFSGHESNLIEEVPAEAIKNTDLASIQPFQDKIPTVKKKMILFNVVVPNDPSWKISVTLSNAGHVQYQHTYTISMYGAEFCTPKVFVRDCSTSIERPTIKLRSERFLFRSSIFPGCGKTSSGISQLIVVWHLHRLSKEYPKTSSFNEVNTADKGNSSDYDVPPFSLAYGLYGLKLFVDEIPAKPTNKQRGSKLFVCWIMLKSKPLTCVIADGTEKEVGTQQTITVDASESVDENEPSGTDMSYLIFSWNCNPPLPTSVIDFTIFGGNAVILDPGTLKSGRYNFTVTVSVDVKKAPTISDFPKIEIPAPCSASQVVNVVVGKTALLSISCVKNCGKPETVNIHDVIYFAVKCLDLCVGSDLKGYYHWTANNNLHLDKTTTEYGDDTDRLIIKPNIIRPGITYTITVTASPPGLLKARAVTTLKANVPLSLPAGKCTMTPSEGLSGKTRFSIRCNYPTEYMGFPLHYRIFQRAKYDDPNSEILLSYSTSPNQTSLLLNPGDPHDNYKTYLSVQAEDSNHLQYKRENATSAMVKSLFDDPKTDVEKEVSDIMEDAEEYAENSNTPELLALITSTKSSMDASPNKTSAVQNELQSKFVDYIDAVPLLTHQVATQALMALHTVLEAGKGEDASPVSHDTIEVAANVLKKISAKLLQGVNNTEGITSEDMQKASKLVEESTNVLMSGMETSLKTFDAVSPESVLPLEPTDKETGMDYSAYSDLDLDYLKNKNSYEKASMSILTAMDDYTNAIGSFMAPGEKEKITKSPNMTTYVKVEKPELLTGQLLTPDNNGGLFIPKELGKLIQKDVEYLEIHITVSDRNPFGWDPESRNINTKLLTVSIIDHRTGEEIEWKWKKPVQIFISPTTVRGNQTELSPSANFSSPNAVTGSVSVPVQARNDEKVLSDAMRVYKVRAKKGLKPYLMFEEPSDKLKVAVGVNLRPSLKDMKLYSQIIANTVMIEGVALTDHDYFYIAVLPHENALQDAAQIGIDTLTVPFKFLVLLVGCRSWNVIKMRWNSDGCEAGLKTGPNLLHCNCDHLSAFMGSIFVVPALLETRQDMNVMLLFGESYVICKFVLIILLLSLLPLLLVCWLDRRAKTRHKAMLVILEDNEPGEEYAYLIGVYTGFVPDSASTCHVSFQMFGERAASKVHLLMDTKRRYLWSRNSDNWFVVYTSSWLGDLRSISVWHDSWGHDPTWYCEKILVHDVQRNEVWVFLVQRYLSVLAGDGTIFCSKEPATRKQITHKKLLFKDHFNICLREEHMWLSVFRRHPRSKYTRTERLAVCMCYIMLCMLISIVMYGIPYKDPAEQITASATEDIGTEVCVVVFTNLLAIPLVLLLMLLFRKTGPKKREEMDAEDDDINCICCPYMKTMTSCKLPPPSDRRSHGKHTCDKKHETCHKRCKVCCRRHAPKHAGRCCVSLDDPRKRHSALVQPVSRPVVTTESDARKRQPKVKISASLEVKFRDPKSGKIRYYRATFRDPPRRHHKTTEYEEPSESDVSFNKSYTVPPDLRRSSIAIDQENKSFTEIEEVMETPSQDKYVPSNIAITWEEYTKRKLSGMKYIFLDFILMDPLVIQTTCSRKPDKNKENLEGDDYRSTIPRYWFRHCWKYWAWLLCILIIALCALLVCRIGVQYGDMKSRRWIVLMAIIIITSFVIWETLKVYLLALILAYGYKIQAKHYQLHPDICWDKIKKGKGKNDKRKSVPKQPLAPMAVSRLKILRDKQSTRKNLGLLMKDILMFGAYITLQAYVVYILLDDSAYYSTRAIEEVIIQPSSLAAITNHSQFINYMKVDLIPALHQTEDYNGEAFTRNGITALYDTQLLGVVLLRQVRVRKDACKIEPVLHKIFSRCRVAYSEKTMDSANYSIGWHKFDQDTFREIRSSTPWLYNEGYLEAQGVLHVYPPSGYIVQLGRTLNNSLTIIQFLEDYQWLDRYTRATIIRFALYNANQNLFNIVTMVVEVDHTGAFMYSYSVDTMTLLISYKNLGWFVIIVIFLWMLILAVFLMEKVIQVKKVSVKGYLKDLWNFVDLLIIAVAVTAVVLALLRNVKVQHLMRHLEEKDHNEYVDFSRIALWQVGLISLTGFLICVSTIRLWKVLRWNYIFRTCESALFRGTKTLFSLAVFTGLTVISFGSFLYLYIGNLDYYFSSALQAFNTVLIAGFGFRSVPISLLIGKSFLFAGTVVVLYWLVYIAFWLNLFITVVMHYYSVARAYYAYLRIQYSMRTYLKEEVAYQLGRYDIEYRDEQYFTNMSENIVQQPWDIDPIAVPKPDPVRLLNTVEITRTQLRIMRQIIEDYFVDSKTSNMKTVCRATIMEHGVPKDDLEPEVFHCGLDNNAPKTVSDSKLEEMYTLVNYHYYHVFSPSPARHLDDAMSEILGNLDKLSGVTKE